MDRFKIRTRAHIKTGLVVAFCDDLPGFFVHGRSAEEILGKLEAAFRQFMKARGEEVGAVEISEDEPDYQPIVWRAEVERLRAA